MGLFTSSANRDRRIDSPDRGTIVISQYPLFRALQPLLSPKPPVNPNLFLLIQKRLFIPGAGPLFFLPLFYRVGNLCLTAIDACDAPQPGTRYPRNDETKPLNLRGHHPAEIPYNHLHLNIATDRSSIPLQQASQKLATPLNTLSHFLHTMPSSTPAGGASATPDALESDLLTKLSATSALEDLQESLLSSLHRVGWTEKITSLATELLRAGRCETFDDVMEAVVASAEGRTHPALGSKNTAQNGGATSNGTKEAKSNGTKKGDASGGGKSDAPYDPVKYIEEVDVRIPEPIVDEGVRRLKDILREMVDLEDENTPNGDKK